MRKTLRVVGILCAICLLFGTLLAFCACNSSSVVCGVVIKKSICEPTLFDLGALTMTDPRRGVTNFSVWVKDDEGKTGKFYVSEDEYKTIAVGDFFVYDNTRHFRA